MHQKWITDLKFNLENRKQNRSNSCGILSVAKTRHISFLMLGFCGQLHFGEELVLVSVLELLVQQLIMLKSIFT
jgi:hypothetical protein